MLSRLKVLHRLSIIPPSRVCSLTFVLGLGLAMFCVQPSVAGQDSGWGNLTGQIVVDGEVPQVNALTVDKDRATCLRDQDKILDPSLVVGKEGGLKDAFVMMYFARGAKQPEVHESYLKTQEAKVVLDNVKCKFEPYALFLRTSQTLTMKNSDDVGHNCHVVLFNNEINANIPVADEVDVQLTKTERVPGPVKCDIHPWMSAVLLVRDEPYAAITDGDGRFTIENLPAGEWSFQFWHVRPGYMKNLTREGEKFLDARRGTVTLKIVANETLDLGQLMFPASDLDTKN